MVVNFRGKGIALCGTANDAILSIKLNGTNINGNFIAPDSSFREVFYHISGLENQEHEIEITIKNGSLGVDAMEVTL